MAPMIDMTFLLFSFVLVTSNFERPEGVLASQLPQSTASSVALPFSPIVVRLSQAGPADGPEIRIDRFTDSPRTLAELPGLLAEVQRRPGFDRDTPVVIAAGDEVQWDHVVGAWNAALRAGCTNIAFSEQQ